MAHGGLGGRVLGNQIEACRPLPPPSLPRCCALTAVRVVSQERSALLQLMTAGNAPAWNCLQPFAQALRWEDRNSDDVCGLRRALAPSEEQQEWLCVFVCVCVCVL